MSRKEGCQGREGGREGEGGIGGRRVQEREGGGDRGKREGGRKEEREGHMKGERQGMEIPGKKEERYRAREKILFCIVVT